MNPQRINASEIARLAGVSRATVSRVINRYEYVKPETRARVMRVIEEYSYRPDLSAQVLAGKSRSTHTVGLFFVGDTSRAAESRMDDTHLNFMVERVILTAAEREYYVLVDVTCNINDPSEQQRIRNMFTQHRVDAGIFVGFPNDYPMIEDLIAKRFVVGVFDQYLADRNEPNRVVVRFEAESFAMAVDYAAGLGHRDIMLVNGDLLHRSGEEKLASFLEGMRRNGLTVKKDYVMNAGRFTREDGEIAFKEFLKSGLEMPTCICCGNDLIAFGVIGLLRQLGYRVPEDVSVIGSDDILISGMFNPPLTTIHYDFDQIMETLTSRVIACSQEMFSRQFCQLFGGRLVVRKSCAAPRAQREKKSLFCEKLDTLSNQNSNL